MNNLKKVYKNVNDVELYTGGASEKKTDDGHIGATFSCIQAYQYYIMKFGDRFWFENGHDESTRFTPEQLKEIRKTSFSRMLCDNVELDSIPIDAFKFADKKKNPSVKCSELPKIDLGKWKENEYNDKNYYEKTNMPQKSYPQAKYEPENHFKADKYGGLFDEAEWEQNAEGIWFLNRD